MKKIALLVIATVAALVSSGCVSLMQGLAEEPYRKAVQQGRMSPLEYQRQKEEIRRASEGAK